MKNLIKTDWHSNHRYIKERGHMLAFLLTALAVASWANVFQSTVSAEASAYYGDSAYVSE